MQLSRFSELICVITLILFACFPVTVSAQFTTFPEPVCQTDGNRKLIIFIHGWRGNDQGSWEAFPTLICGESDLGSPDVISVNYPTYIFRQNASIAEAADWFVTQIDARQMHDRYDTIIICAYSMGGLIARKMILLKILNDGNAGSFRLLLEFGTPHLGISIKMLDKIARILGVAVDATKRWHQTPDFSGVLG